MMKSLALEMNGKENQSGDMPTEGKHVCPDNDNVEEETLVIPRNTVPTPVAPPEPLSVNTTPQVSSKPPPCRIDETPQNPKRLLYSCTPTPTNQNRNSLQHPFSWAVSSNHKDHTVVPSSGYSEILSSQKHPTPRKKLIQSPPERNLTTSSRVNNIVSQLQELNLLSSSKNSFLSMFQTMQRSIASCNTYSSREDQSNALNGMLVILESSIEEIQNVSQECQYWKQKAAQQNSDSTIISSTSSENEQNENFATSVSSTNNKELVQMKEIKDENTKLKTVLEDLGFSYLIPSLNDDRSVFSNNNDDNTSQFSMRHDLQNRVSLLQNENASLRQSMQELSNARFQLEMQYNKALLSSSSSPSTKNTARATLERKRVQELLKQEQQLHAALAKKDMECVHAQETIHRLQMQTEILQTNQSNQDTAINQWRVELDSARRNSQSLAVENARLQSELTTLRQKLTQEMQRADQSQHDANAAKIGRNELASNYRVVADERLRLEKELEEKSRETADLTQSFSTLQLEQSRSQNQIQALGNDMQQRVAQIYQLERELEQTRRNSDALCAKLKAVEEKNLETANDLESSRRSSKLMGQQTLELQSLLAKSQQDASAFRNMVIELEKDRDRWRQFFHEEKDRGLEELLSSARANEAAASEQVKKLARQNAYLATELNKANARQQIFDNKT